LPSYSSISNAAVGNTIDNQDVIFLPTAACKILVLTWQGIDLKLPEDDTIVSKHVGV